MILRPLTLDECQQVRVWRNQPDVLPMLRTKEPLTEAQQATFYRDVVSNPDSDHRYYALEHDGQFIGMGGLTYLSRNPGEAEISLILGPAWRGQGFGSIAVDVLLAESGRIGLETVRGECYQWGNRGFWATQLMRLERSRHWFNESGSLCWVWSL